MALSEQQFNLLKQRLQERKNIEERTPEVSGERPDRTGLFRGVGKQLLETVRGASALGERGVRVLGRVATPKALEEPLGFAKREEVAAERLIPEEAITPIGPQEKIGKFVGSIAEFLVPGSAALKIERAVSGATKLQKVPKLAKTLGLAGRSGAEAGIITGISAINEGEINKELTTPAIVGAVFPVAGRAVTAAKGFLKPVGEKIQFSVIKPQQRDIADGFKIENVNKFKVGGTLEETVAKTHSKINQLVTKLDSKLEGAKETVNLNSVLESTIKRLTTGKARQFGDIGATNRIINKLEEEVKEVAGRNGIVNLVDATNIKRGAGTKGAWSFGNPDPDASATERVYTTFYNDIRKAIEKAAPVGIREINKDISSLIPISNAALRRLPIEQRNNVLSLTDSIGLFSSVFDPRALVLLGASKLSRSGRFGQFLVDLAEKRIKPERLFGE